MLEGGWMFQNDKHSMPIFLRWSSSSYSECSAEPCEASTGSNSAAHWHKRKVVVGEGGICESDLGGRGQKVSKWKRNV